MKVESISGLIGEREAAAASARSALGAAAPWKTAQVDSLRLAYNDAGQGPEIVCLHAIGHGAREFARLSQRFSGRYRVIALDWPGHGNSGDDRAPASAVRYAEVLRGFLEETGIERPVLVGNSIGGATALRYAAACPDRVRALVLENPGGLAPIDRPSRAAIAMIVRFFSAGARGARWFPAAFRFYYAMVLRKPAARADRERIVAAGREMAPVLAQAWKSFGEPQADLRALAPEVKCPILFAWAKRDWFVQLKPCLEAIGRFPHARLETFDAGHAAHLEAPEAFEESLERFLAGLPA